MAEQKETAVPSAKEGKQEEQATVNEVRVGQRRSEAYVKIAEQLFLQFEEITLCGLGNSKYSQISEITVLKYIVAIRTVVSVGEILKNRKYATITSKCRISSISLTKLTNNNKFVYFLLRDRNIHD